MTSHTPGPWVVTDEDPPRIIATDDRATIVAITTAPRANESNMADARLIAAAPELLFHAKADLATLEYFIGNPSAWESYDDMMSARLLAVVNRAREAIAKAEGK